MLFVCRGIRHAHGIERFRYSDNAFALNEPPENLTYSLCRRLVNNQPMPVIGAFFVSVAGKRAYKFALLSANIQRASDIDGRCCNNALVYDILHADRNTLRSGVHTARCSINSVIQHNKPDIALNEKTVNNRACFDVVSAQARQILYDNTVDDFRLNIANHSFKRRTAEIRAGPAVVNIKIDNFDIALLSYILLQNFSLRYDRTALAYLFVLL